MLILRLKETYRHNAEYMDWLVKYANLPYIDAYYQLQKDYL